MLAFFPSCNLRDLCGYLLLPASPVYETPNAILEMHNIEVYKQSQRFATQLQVRKDLGLMDRGERVYGFQFNNDEILDEQIDPISEIQLHAIVINRQTDLSFRPKTGLRQFVLQASLIGAFKESWSQICMNPH